MIRLYTVVFLSGAALMGLEFVGSRVMAPVFGTSIFVWGALITTFPGDTTMATLEQVQAFAKGGSARIQR